MTNEQQWAEVNEERLWRLEEAIREALTRGTSLESIRILCFESGASYTRVVGQQTEHKS
jgi:hypothetical protein